MKIALLATQFGDYSAEAARGLMSKVDLLLLADSNQLSRDADPECRSAVKAKARLVTFSQKRKPNRIIACAKSLAALKKFGPDVIVTHEHAHPHVTWIQERARKIAPLLLTVHDPQPHSGRDAEFARRNARWTDAQRNLASALIVHGEHCASAVRLIKPEKRIFSVPHGPILRPRSYAALPKDINFLFFGRMEAYKGLETLLDACPILEKHGFRASINISGSGPEIDRLKPAFSRFPFISVDTNFVQREELIKLMGNSSIVLVPYTEATQSGVVSAAFANARGVIATAVGGIPDWVNDKNGILIQPRDPSALANAILRVSEDPDLAQRLSTGAVDTAETGMSWDSYASIILDCAKQVIGYGSLQEQSEVR